MAEKEILDLYEKKIILKVKNYISELEITRTENPDKVINQIAYYSSQLNNTSDYIIQEIFIENKIDLEALFKENPFLYFKYSNLIRKSWIIKIKTSREFDDYCETFYKEYNQL